MKKLACFDLDGTLFDTGLVNYYAYMQALSEVGFELDKDYYVNKCNGRHYTEFLPIITGTNEKELLEKVHNRKKELYKNFLDKVIVNDALFDIINALRNSGCKTVVVTTASKANTTDILEYFGKLDCFDKIITAEDYKLKKPHPEAYELAMKLFNVMPDETMIFEDSDVGIEAAIKSGASVFSINKF